MWKLAFWGMVILGAAAVGSGVVTLVRPGPDGEPRFAPRVDDTAARWYVDRARGWIRAHVGEAP